MSSSRKEHPRVDRVAAHKNDDAEYVMCVDFAMDALADKRLKLRAVARLIRFNGTKEQNEHIDRLLERLGR